MTDWPAITPVEVKYLVQENGYHPQAPHHEGDVGMDICAALGKFESRRWHPDSLLDEDGRRYVVVAPLEGAFVPGGFCVQFSRGWAGLVLPRSSSNRRGLHVCTGVIDNGYTGEIGVEVRNISSSNLVIYEGDRVAQLVLLAAFRPTPVEVTEFEPTDRGDKGFGSTG